VKRHAETSLRPFRLLTVQQQILLLLVALDLAVTLVFAGVLFSQKKRALMTGIDNKLQAVAVMARELLPPDYHDRITGPESVTEQEFDVIVGLNNKLCVSLGLEYVWSLMMIDHKIVFTSATSPDKIAENGMHAKFFEAHSNPELYMATFDSMRPVFKTNVDKWGRIRVALIPSLDRHGRKFLFGASISLAEVNRQLRGIVYQSLTIGLVLFLASVVLGYWVTRRVTQPIRKLTATLQAISAGANDLEAEEKGAYEVIVLAQHFNRLNRVLHGKISVLEASQENMIGRHRVELREAEATRIFSEQRYRNLLNFAVDGILIGTNEGVIMEANECMCGLFGMPREEIVGKHLSLMPFTEESVKNNPFRYDLVHQGQVVVRERSIRRPDGTELVVEIHTKMMHDGTLQSIYRDITERKRAEEKLVKSEQRYRNLLNFAVDGILACTNDGTLIEVNECLCELCGMNRDELLGKRVTDLPFTPECLKERPLRIDLVQSGESLENERVLRRRDGTEVVVEMRTKMMPDGIHQSIWHDVTQRKLAEETLRETRRMLEEAQDIAKLGAWKYDIPTARLTWSEQVYRIHGLGHDFDINRLAQDVSFLAPEHAPLMREAFRAAVERGVPYDLEVELIRPDGRHIWVHASGRPVVEDGQVIRVDGNLMDITERKQAEEKIRLNQQELARQNELLTALMQNLAVGVFMVEVPSGKPLVANPAACRLLGQGLLPDVNADNLATVYVAHKAGTQAAYPVEEMPILLGMKGLSAHVDDLVVVRPDGTERLLEIFGSPVKDEQGRVWASLVSFADITERKRAQDLLESWNASLERSVAERTREVEKYASQLQALTGRLMRVEEDERKRISDVLHEDLQQMLVAARMTLDVARKTARSQKGKEVLSRTDSMLEQSVRLTRSLVQEIAVPAVREGDLPAAFRWIAEQMKSKFGLTVEVRADEGLQPVCENTYLCLYRAVQEILFNAVKHAKVWHAVIDVQKIDDNNLCVTVSDGGVGFEVADVKESGASGIGLFGIRQRVEGLGGCMDIRSVVGQGTAVELILPVRDRDAVCRGCT